MKLNFNYQFAKNFFNENELKQIKPYVELANEVLTSKSGAGNDFLGWVDLPENYDKDEFARIKKAAEKIKIAIIFILVEYTISIFFLIIP